MILIHDKRLPEEYLKGLRRELPKAEPIPLQVPENSLYGSISCHPDIWSFRLDKRTLVHAPSLAGKPLDRLREAGARLVKGEKDPFGRYPGTAPYNASRIGRFFLHRLRHTDPRLLAEASKRGLEQIDVKQGYTGCSVLPAGERALITSDRGIAEDASLAGLEVLLIRPGHIILPGQLYGFIGGAALALPGREIIFLGDISYHPDHNKIKAFLGKRDITYREIVSMPLFDAGGIHCLDL